MENLVKELNKYFEKNDHFISSDQFKIYAFVYLDEEENLTTDTQAAEISFSAELTYLDSDDEESWDKLTFNLDDPEWVKVLEELASQIIEYK